MEKYLVCRLRAPFAAWGDIAIGIERPSRDHPSKSAITGLLAAALGIERQEEAKQKELAESFNFAVLVNMPGNFLRDFHTTQMPSESAGKRRKFESRAAELALSDDELETIVSTRDYYTDVMYTIAIWMKDEKSSFSLEEFERKLKQPEFLLYLGRKSCSLSLPVEAQIVACNDLVKAISKTEFKCAGLFKKIKTPERVRLYWEGDVPGLVPSQTTMRRDYPLSRTRWQFTNRQENYTTIELEQEG